MFVQHWALEHCMVCMGSRAYNPLDYRVLVLHTMGIMWRATKHLGTKNIIGRTLDTLSRRSTIEQEVVSFGCLWLFLRQHMGCSGRDTDRRLRCIVIERIGPFCC